MKESRTTNLFQELRNLPKDNHAYQNFLSSRQAERQYTSLYEFLTTYLATHPDITIPSIVFRSNLSPNYVYPILNGKRLHPSKYKLVALCIGAHMNIKKTQRALMLAGCTELHPKIDADAGIILCINNDCDTVMEVEAFLEESGVRSPF